MFGSTVGSISWNELTDRWFSSADSCSEPRLDEVRCPSGLEAYQSTRICSVLSELVMAFFFCFLDEINTVERRAR
jgi:hypothetical protein